MAESSAVLVDDKGVRLTSDKAARFVILSNQNLDTNGVIEADLNNDNYKTSGNEIFWGFNGQYPHPLYPSQTTPFLIPVQNASEITLKTRVGTRLIHYTIIF